MKNFRELVVWKKSHELTINIYAVTKNFPKEELYGLVSQMRRYAASIPSNIAEGCGRQSDKELARFLVIASGSASELEYQLLLSRDLNLIQQTTYDTLVKNLTEIHKMLNSFIRKLRPDLSQKP